MFNHRATTTTRRLAGLFAMVSCGTPPFGSCLFDIHDFPWNVLRESDDFTGKIYPLVVIHADPVKGQPNHDCDDDTSGAPVRIHDAEGVSSL